ncbi:MAG: hypothetical protein IKS49_08185 [Actinomycetaceae bacterium]|nr:hypothetical protein [Actinomycetaceae bacterium]
MAEQRTFSTILTQAIASSGLSLTDIVNKLDQQGLTLSAASLSYWKTGKTLPTRKTSRPILEAIEDICSLAPGTLFEAAQSDSNANRGRHIPASTSKARIPDNTHTQVPRESEDLESDIDWSYEAEREILIDSFHISPDFMTIQGEITILARITHPSYSHLHISSYLSADEGEFADNETGLRYIEGAAIGDVIRHKNSKSLTVRLDLPEESKVGDLRRVFYLPPPYHASEPCTASPIRHFAWPLRMYNCHIFFEGKVPENIEWVTEETQERGISRVKHITTQRIQPSGNTVQISLENVQGVMGYFRWS